MQDYEKIKELESYGDSEEDREELKEEELYVEPGHVKKYSLIPLLQLAFCAAILLTLFYLKVFKPEMYTEITGWYQKEIAEEIELPKLADHAEPEESTASTVSEMDSIKDLDSAEGQSV